MQPGCSFSLDQVPCHRGERPAPRWRLREQRREAHRRPAGIASRSTSSRWPLSQRCRGWHAQCRAARESAGDVVMSRERAPGEPLEVHGSSAPAEPKLTPSSSAGLAGGSFLGAVSLISTNTIGAGILALPATSAPAGFIPSATVLLTVWALLTMDAFLIAEVNIAVREEQALQSGGDGASDGIVTLRQMAGATLGPWGASAVSIAYLFIAYSLLVAYDSKIGGIAGSLALGLSPLSAAVVFTGAMAAIISAGPGLMINLSRGSMLGMLGMYAIIMAVGADAADWSALSAADWSQAPATIPILLLALVYHDLIPVVVTLLKGDRGAVRGALLLGSIAPLAMFLGWNLVALAQPHGSGAGAGAALAGRWDPVQQLIDGGSEAVATAVVCFSVLAITTSFLGAALGLTATLATEFRAAASAMRGSPKARGSHARVEEMDPDDVLGNMAPGVKAGLLAVSLGPPLFICAQNPDAFFGMLEVAGGYGMTALYGMMPPIMAWRLRGSRHAPPSTSTPDNPRPAATPETSKTSVSPPSPSYTALLPGGYAVLAMLACCATSVELGRLAIDTGITPAALVRVGQAANEALAQLALAVPATLWLNPGMVPL